MKQVLAGVTAALLAGSVASAQGLFPGVAIAPDDGRPGVTVTATGRGTPPAAIGQTFQFMISGKAASAVEAQRLREARLQQVLDAAHKFGVELEALDAGFSSERDAAAQNQQMEQWRAANASHLAAVRPPDLESVPQLFVATSVLRVRDIRSDRLAPFLDALRAAGVDDLSTMLGGGAAGLSAYMLTFERLGLVADDRLDEATWARADADAMAQARQEAQDIAASAGRTLGPVEKVTNDMRSAIFGEATVTLTVRFAFGPDK